jgi:hypothetical protein
MSAGVPSDATAIPSRVLPRPTWSATSNDFRSSVSAMAYSWYLRQGDARSRGPVVCISDSPPIS